MNILVVNHYAGSPTHGMEFRPYYLGREWAKAGHKCFVVAGSYSHLRIEQPKVPWLFASENVDGIDYIWVRSLSYRGNGIRRGLSILCFLATLVLLLPYLLVRTRPDVVVASSTYPADIFPSWLLARLVNGKLVYEVHDLWPLTLIELAGMSPRHPLILFFQVAENFAYRNADSTVSMLPYTLDHMTSHGLDPARFVYIPNGVVDVPPLTSEHQVPLPEAVSVAIASLARRCRFLVVYAGYHGIANSLDAFIEAAAWLAPQGAGFILVGDGPEKERLVTKAAALAESNSICFLPPVPKDAVPQLLSRADLVYLGWEASPLYRFGTNSNKLLDYMLAKKPVLQAFDYRDELLENSGCGFCVKSGDAEAIAAGIQRFMTMPEEQRVAMGERGRKYVLKHRVYSDLAARFLVHVNVQKS